MENEKSRPVFPRGVIFILSVALTTCGLAADARSVPHRKPNLVLILADDLGYGDLGCFGGDLARTPNLDRLAAGGARLTDFYVNAPVCSPSRASLLTGRVPQRHGLTNVIETNDHATRLALDEVLLPQLLRQSGYASGIIGKWHVGEPPPARPNARGFDYFFGGLLGGMDYFKHSFGSYGHDLWRNQQEVFRDGEYITGLIGEEADKFITAHRTQPFFLFVSFTAPHTAIDERNRFSQYQAPARLLKPEAPEGEPPGGEMPGGDLNDAVKYRAMVTALDEVVGRLLAALRGNGLEKNTLVLFLSDNGPDPNPKLVGSAGPLRGSKHTLWEGGIRVPAIAWWPGRIPAGVVRRSYAIGADFFATALALAGVNKPGDLALDGRDIMPLLVSGAPGKSRDLYWSYVRDTLRISRERALRRGKWKWLNGELYDLETDQGERRDLAARHPRLAATLETAWKTWVAQFPREARRWEGRRPQRAGEK